MIIMCAIAANAGDAIVEPHGTRMWVPYTNSIEIYGDFIFPSIAEEGEVDQPWLRLEVCRSS